MPLWMPRARRCLALFATALLSASGHLEISAQNGRDGLASDGVMIEDRHGTLWFGTWGGLSRRDEGGFTIFTEEDGLPSRRISSLLQDPSGRLWIGTDLGVGVCPLESSDNRGTIKGSRRRALRSTLSPDSGLLRHRYQKVSVTLKW